MNEKGYHFSITVNATPEETFARINEVSKWWATHMEGRSEKVNDVFTTRFSRMFATFKITESVPGRKVEWLVTDSNMPWLQNSNEWNGTKVRFKITPKNGSTEIAFTHIGLLPEVECYDECVYGWDLHVKQSLKSLITKGKGQPAY